MKKIIVSAFCSVVLLSAFGSTVALADEIITNNLQNTSLVDPVNSKEIQNSPGYINGIYYRFYLKTGGVKPPKRFNGMWLVATAIHNGSYYGYYR